MQTYTDKQRGHTHVHLHAYIHVHTHTLSPSSLTPANLRTCLSSLSTPPPHCSAAACPEWWKPHFTRGLALRAGERFDDAVAAFQRAHNLLPIGDVKADQCTTAIRDTRALQAQAQQELSKKKLDDIESARKNSMAADQLPCKRVRRETKEKVEGWLAAVVTGDDWDNSHLCSSFPISTRFPTPFPPPFTSSLPSLLPLHPNTHTRMHARTHASRRSRLGHTCLTKASGTSCASESSATSDGPAAAQPHATTGPAQTPSSTRP